MRQPSILVLLSFTGITPLLSAAAPNLAELLERQPKALSNETSRHQLALEWAHQRQLLADHSRTSPLFIRLRATLRSNIPPP